MELEWKYERVDIEYELTSEQIRKINNVIKTECCNYGNGNCELLDNGEYHKCKQMSRENLRCKWFEEAVLPLNKELKNEIIVPDDTLDKPVRKDETQKKRCIVCGKQFVPKSNSSKYCEKCTIEVTRKQTSERQRKKRSKSRIRTNL